MKDALNYEAALEAASYVRNPTATEDFIVFIGRFQPFHLGHRACIVQALKQGKIVVILVGSANSPRWYFGPWNVAEITRMIRESFTDEENRRIVIRGVEDHHSNTGWIENVQAIVEQVVNERHDFTTDPRIALIGHEKDETSFYLKSFPQWPLLNVDCFLDLAATRMREGVFSNICDAWLGASTEFLPPNVAGFISEFAKTPDYRHLLDEFEFVRSERQKWSGAPYPVTFTTTDAVVIQSGHILLVERGEHPFKGTLALPGGHLKPGLTLLDNMIDELREETRIQKPDAVLRGSIVGPPEVFDKPRRDPRGRYITHAYLLRLEPRREQGFKLPEVRAATDAKKAEWYPLADIKRQDLAFDHFDIIAKLKPRITD